MNSTIRNAALCLAILATAGCGDDDNGGPTGGPSPGELYRVVVTPAHATTAVGTELDFLAHGEDANGRAVTIDPVWSVPTSHIGRIDQDGHFIANCIADTGVVRATAAGKFSGASTVIVTATAGAVATLEIDPDTLTVDAAGSTGGERVQFYLVARNATGAPVAVLPAWDVVPPEIGVMLNEFGLFEARAAGNGTVRVTVGNVVATAIVHVVAP